MIAPPAVVGNWAAEAARFTPELRAVVHHGASRASADELEAEVAGADVVITTYGTAVRDVEALAERTWSRMILDEAQAIKNPANETSQLLRRISARSRLALTGTPIENGVGDLWALLDFTNPGLVGTRPAFVAQMAGEGEAALRALNGILVFRRTKSEPEVAAELPDRIDELDHCTMTAEQIGLYQAVLDDLVANPQDADGQPRQGAILAAITALKQICNHPAAYQDDGRPLAGRSGKLARLEEIVESVFAAGERILVFTHFASWGRRLAEHLTETTGIPIACYDGGLSRGTRDRIIAEFQQGTGAGALILSLKAGGTGLNLTAASHVVLYDRWWNPAVEDQARDRAWRIGQTRTVVSPPAGVPGHGGRAGRGGRRRQASHRQPRAAGLQLAGRPRRPAAAGRPRAPTRHPAHRGGVVSTPRRRRPQPRRNDGQRSVDLWRPVRPLPDLEPIVPADDATALLRSLGPPPLDRHSLAGEHYLATVVERAAALATGLAAAAQVLTEADDDGGREDVGNGGA